MTATNIGNENVPASTVVYGSPELMKTLRSAGYTVRQLPGDQGWVYNCTNGACGEAVEYEMQAWAAAKENFLYNFPRSYLPSVSAALQDFMNAEAANCAEEGLAYEIAKSLKAEADEAGPMALQLLPSLKSAILIYAIELALDA